MFAQLDDDSIIHIIGFLSLSDVLEHFSVINSDIYQLFNDRHIYLINLIIDRILYSEEHFIALFNHIEKNCQVESLLDEEERKLINCLELSRVCKMENYDEKKVIQRILSEEIKYVQIDDYLHMKTFWNLVKRLSYMNILWMKTDFTTKNIDLCYCMECGDYDSSDTYGLFITLAKSYQLKRDRMYKFTLQVIDGFKVIKIYSKARESKRNQKEIILKTASYIEFQSATIYEPNIKVLLHQESIENDLTISIPNIQDSNAYKNRCYMVRNDMFSRPLYDINSYFHDISSPNRCGDLRASRKGDSVLFTISRNEIKQLLFRFMIANTSILAILLYLFRLMYLFTNEALKKKTLGYMDLIMHFLDGVAITQISFLISDYFTNKIRRRTTDFLTWQKKVIGTSILLKIAVTLISPWDFMTNFFSTLPVSAPVVFLIVSIGTSSFTLGLTLFWYTRSCDWFYKMRKKESLFGRVFKKCTSWITNFFSLQDADNDTEERCVIN